MRNRSLDTLILRLIFVAAVGAAVAIGCSDDGDDTNNNSSTNNAPSNNNASGNNNSANNNTSNNNSATTGMAMVGSDGGIVVDETGDASVDIPQGSLTSNTLIGVAKIPSAEIAPTPTNTILAGDPIAFTPHGTLFAAPVTIQISYDSAIDGPLQILRLDDEADTEWEVLSGGNFNGGVASIDVSSFSVLAVATTSMPSTTPLLTITGTTTPDANVVVTVGTVSFTGTADSTGRYTVAITAGDNDDLMSIRTQGSVVQSQEKIELATYLDTLSNLISQAGADTTLDDTENRATRLNALTTARYVLVNDVNGGPPTTRVELAAADRNIAGGDTLFFGTMAAAIQLLIDDPSRMPESATTLSFASDRDAVVAFAFDQTSDPDDFTGLLPDATEALAQRTELFAPFNPPIGERIFEGMTFLKRFGKIPGPQGGVLRFNADGTGRSTIERSFVELSASSVSSPFTWSTNSGSLVYEFDTPAIDFFTSLDVERVLELINDPPRESEIRSAYANLISQQFQVEFTGVELLRAFRGVGADYVAARSIYTYRLAAPFAEVGLTVPDIEEPLSFGLTVWTRVSEYPTTAFTDDQVRGQSWALRVLGPSRYALSNGFEVDDSVIFQDLVTFSSEGQTATVQAGLGFSAPISLTWTILPNGALELTYPNGAVQRHSILATESGSLGLLTELNVFDATYYEYGPAISVDPTLSITTGDLVTTSDRYWQSNINATAHERRRADVPSRAERFGYLFQSNGEVDRLLNFDGSYNGQSFDPDFIQAYWRYELAGGKILINAFNSSSRLFDDRCPQSDLSCTIGEQREWTPLRRVGGLLYVIEWNKRWPRFPNEPTWDATAQVWRDVNGDIIDDSIFEWSGLPPRLNSYYITTVAEP